MDGEGTQAPGGGIIAHLTIRDGRAAQAIEFYKRAFGAASVMEPHMADDGKRVMHAHLVFNGGHLMLADDFPEYDTGESAPGGFVLHLQVEDADAAFNRATDAGATVVMPLADQFWGDRYGQVRDPFGIRWSIGAPLAAPSE